MNTEKTIITANEGYIEGYDGAFLHYVDADGCEYACGIWDHWYKAHAKDNEGNDYFICWEIAYPEHLDDSDESLLCDWDYPYMVIRDGKNVIDDVIVVWE